MTPPPRRPTRLILALLMAGAASGVVGLVLPRAAGAAPSGRAAAHAAGRQRTLLIKITTTGGATWGKVTVRYIFHHRHIRRVCSHASCRFVFPFHVKVHLRQQPRNSESWPFLHWQAKPLGPGHPFQTLSKPAIARSMTRGYVVRADYGLAQVRAAHTQTLGTILVDAQGMTLYHLTTETNGRIVCTGSCARAWPPLLMPSGMTRPVAGTGVTGLGTVTRPDGSVQVTDRGMPLYLYEGDKKPGDTVGQGIGGIWYVVPASGSTSSGSGWSP